MQSVQENAKSLVTQPTLTTILVFVFCFLILNL